MDTPAKCPDDHESDLFEEEPDNPEEEPCPSPPDPPENLPGDEYAELGGDDDTDNWKFLNGT